MHLIKHDLHIINFTRVLIAYSVFIIRLTYKK